MYRIINRLVAIEPPPFMDHIGAATRGQQHKYIVPYSRTTVHKESFFLSTRRRKVVVLFAFLHTLSIWLFHDRFRLMVIPRYFPLDVMFNSFIWMKYDDGMILRLTRHLWNTTRDSPRSTAIFNIHQ
jgi:hypothetical protein